MFAVYEVNAKLLAVQSVALESQEKQAALAQRIGELEKEIAELKDWNREAERYQLRNRSWHVCLPSEAGRGR